LILLNLTTLVVLELYLQFIQKIGGTPTGKDVSYITPDGEEISSKRQLQKHLKGHPGGPTGANFDWTSGALLHA
jgi:hypothetical protein